MLLNRQLGTWFFLAEIFTTLELPLDPPQVARCGSCTRCIDGLSDRRDHCAAPTRRAPLHFLSDDRVEREHPARVPAADRRSHLRLRRLSRCLPVESLRAGVARERICRAAGGRADARCAISSRWMTSSSARCFAGRRSSGSSGAVFCATSASRSATSGRRKTCRRWQSRRGDPEPLIAEHARVGDRANRVASRAVVTVPALAARRSKRWANAKMFAMV